MGRACRLFKAVGPVRRTQLPLNDLPRCYCWQLAARYGATFLALPQLNSAADVGV